MSASKGAHRSGSALLAIGPLVPSGDAAYVALRASRNSSTRYARSGLHVFFSVFPWVGAAKRRGGTQSDMRQQTQNRNRVRVRGRYRDCNLARGHMAPHRGVPGTPLSTRAHGAPPGRAGFDIVSAPTSRRLAALRTMSYRATLAVDRSGASVPVRKEAAGARAAWSQIFPLPPRDHAARATLGHRGRHRRPRCPRRPELRVGRTVLVAVADTCHSERASRRIPTAKRARSSLRKALPDLRRPFDSLGGTRSLRVTCNLGVELPRSG